MAIVPFTFKIIAVCTMGNAHVQNIYKYECQNVGTKLTTTMPRIVINYNALCM